MKKIFKYRAKKISRLTNAIICTVIIFMSISTVIYGQRNYLFENISIPEGLSNTEVHSVFQDSNGYLWISTADGLNRYDGYTIKIFKNDPNDSRTIANNNCFAIAEDADGYIWVGIIGNIIARYDPKDESFKSYPVDTRSISNFSWFPTALFDSKGDLWFASSYHGMQKFNRSKGAFEFVKLDTVNIDEPWGLVMDITELKNGNILVADYTNGIRIYNNKLNLFQPYYLKANYSPSRINIVYEDQSGSIWFGGRDQLIRYAPSYYTTENFELYSLFESPTTFDGVTGITQDNEGYLWVGVYTQGMFRVDPITKIIQKFDYNMNAYGSSRYERTSIQTIYKDHFNVIWIATQEKGLIKFDPLKEPFKYVQFKTDDQIATIANVVKVISGSPKDEKITIGTSNKGLYSYNLKTKELLKLKTTIDLSGIPNGVIDIQSLAVDSNGDKWFAYNTLGLHKLDNHNSISSSILHQENKTVDYTVNSLEVDLSNNIWLSSSYGFEMYKPSTNKFTLLPTVMNKKMSDSLRREVVKIPESRLPVSSILKVGEALNLEKKFHLDKDQKVLILGIGEGRMTLGDYNLFDYGNLLNSDGELIWTMNDLSKTFNNGGGFKNRISVKCLDLKKGDYKITFTTDVGHSYGSFNVLPPIDSIWYGLQVLNINDAEYKSIKELNQREIQNDKYMPMEIGTCLEISKRLYNVIWLGSMSNSFFKYDLNSKSFKQYNFNFNNKLSSNNTITCIYEDKEGIVWVATLSNLIRFDPITEKLEKYDQKDGLPTSQVNSILEDLQGNLWLSTSGGLSKLNKNAPRDKWSFVNFDTKDGLQGFSSSKASWISSDGEIVLGSNDGIISFYPGKINEIKPNIVIEDIKISGISLKSDESGVSIDNSIYKLDELSLSYTQNNLSFEFTAIHFSRTEKNKVLYMLEGFNTDWVATDRNFVSFTNLNSGEYTFKVKGSNGDGIWNDAGKSIRIIISPPWWQTNWAYVFYILLLALGIFGSDRFFRNRVIRKERERSQARELGHAKEIESAYNDLKATQSQLIQSEKMASLGELTAGIAHEIQNPLNFVNNFSEVNSELIEELIEDRKSVV